MMKSHRFIAALLFTTAALQVAPAFSAVKTHNHRIKDPLLDSAMTPVPWGLPTAASTAGHKSPRLGRIELGAYAPEAALNYGIENPCLMTFDDNRTYRKYRTAVRDTYGADLSDMNYLGVGIPGWQGRYQWFRNWLFRAAPYGDPTIALQPVGPAGYGVFKDGPEMRCLRSAFEQAKKAGITVWVRFASESNDKFNPYSVADSPERVAEYRESVRWFRRYMPDNVRLVFSPLVNDLVLKDTDQIATLQSMYAPGDYDRIGGTIYATSWIDLDSTYSWYYNYMSSLDPNTRFQICELGGTFENKDEIYRFLMDLKDGKWPKVDRVNFFAGELNPIAIRNHGHFGLVLPGDRDSYLRSLIATSIPGNPPIMLASTTTHSKPPVTHTSIEVAAKLAKTGQQVHLGTSISPQMLASAFSPVGSGSLTYDTNLLTPSVPIARPVSVLTPSSIPPAQPAVVATIQPAPMPSVMLARSPSPILSSYVPQLASLASLPGGSLDTAPFLTHPSLRNRPERLAVESVAVSSVHTQSAPSAPTLAAAVVQVAESTAAAGTTLAGQLAPIKPNGGSLVNDSGLLLPNVRQVFVPINVASTSVAVIPPAPAAPSAASSVVIPVKLAPSAVVAVADVSTQLTMPPAVTFGAVTVKPLLTAPVVHKRPLATVVAQSSADSSARPDKWRLVTAEEPTSTGVIPNLEVSASFATGSLTTVLDLADPVVEEPSVTIDTTKEAAQPQTEAPGGKNWRSAVMTLKGTTIAASADYQTFVLMVTDLTTATGEHVPIVPARKKRIYLQPGAVISTSNGPINAAQLASLKGAVTVVTGYDLGKGTPLEASSVVVNVD